MKINWALLSFILVGCASSVSYQYPAPESNKELQILLQDFRSEKGKKAEVMSVNKNSCWFGVYRLGDNQIEPSKLKLFSSYLQKNITEVRVDTLKINRFEMYNNNQRGLRSGISTLSFGLSPVVPSEGQIRSGGCIDAFDLTNNSENKPSIVILYDVVVNRKKYIGKKIQIEPEMRSKGDNVRSQTTKQRIIMAISGVAQEVAVQLNDSKATSETK